MKKTLLLLGIILVTVCQTKAQTVIGKYAGEFMAIGVGGRALGMGGAYAGIANDVTAGYYNPAGLAAIDYPEIALMHDEQFGSLVNYDYAAAAIPFGKNFTFAISIMRLGIDGIPDTRNALVDANGDGVLNIQTDRLDYSKITQFSNQDWAVYLSFAKRASDKFYFGGNVKIIRESLAEYGAWGVGFDVGVWYNPVGKLTLGANLQDITTTVVAWNTGRTELITPTAKLGVGYQVHFLGGVFTPALDVDVRFENRQFSSYAYIGPVSFDTHTGLEYSFKNLIAVRVGYNDVKQFTLGAGIRLPKLSIDYSFARFSSSPDQRLPDSHRISLILTLEEPKFMRK